MPISAKKAENDRRARPNSLSRRERTRKEGKCQLCEAKVPLSEQYTVTNDLEAGTVSKKKNAARKGAETASHYCGPSQNDCAGKRVKQKSDWLASRESGGTKKTKGKSKKGKAAAKKATAKKAVKKTAKKGGKKKAVKKGTKKSGQPF
jgi:hypothetical protein